MDPLHGKVSVDVHMVFDCTAADDLDAIVQVTQWLDEAQAVRQEAEDKRNASVNDQINAAMEQRHGS